MSLSIKPFGFIAIFLFVFISSSYSQDRQFQNDLNLSFEQSAFDGRFCVMVESIGDANYYVIDQTKLPGDFGKIYFLNLVYGDDKIVNIDPGIGRDQMWFKANIVFTVDEIICLFDDLKKRTLEKDATMQATEKEEWLENHNKFNSQK